MCNCYKDKTEELKSKVVEIIKERDKEFTELVSLHQDIIFPSFDSLSFCLKFDALYRREDINGNEQIRKTSVTVLPLYCPFCGEKTGSGKND